MILPRASSGSSCPRSGQAIWYYHNYQSGEWLVANKQAIKVCSVGSRPRPEVLLMALSVVGVAAFTLLFQGRSRYLFTFVPVIVAMTAMVHPAVSVTRAHLLRRISSLRRSSSERS